MPLCQKQKKSKKKLKKPQQKRLKKKEKQKNLKKPASNRIVSDIPFSSFIALIESHLSRQALPGSLVRPYSLPQDFFKKLDMHIPSKGCSYETLFEWLDTFLSLSVDTAHPQFFNQLFGGRLWPAIFGEWVATVINTSMYTYEMASVGAVIERILIEKFNSLVGFDGGDGIFVTGGSNGNLVAMLCARQAFFPAIKEEGMYRTPPLVAFVSEDAHYSFLKAAITLGLGTHHLVRVAVDDQGCMDPVALEQAICGVRAEGKIPFFVGATAGTTVRCAFDPIEDIATVCARQQVWLHIDASFGGAALLSSVHRDKLAGSQLADSFVWDAHKVMNIPLACSAFLVVSHRKNILIDTCKTEGVHYIFHNYDGHEALDTGQKSLQCGRRMDVLKLWLAWMAMGDEGYEQRINTCADHAQYATDYIQKNPCFRLVYPTSFLTVCFQCLPKNECDIHQFNEDLRFELLRSGEVMINQCKEPGKTYFRLVFLDPDRTFSDIDRCFELVSRRF